ncbi:ATP-binding cassette domain-containing protein [Natranaerofaba carboxydovora]|uniref:ATP-binding cassette domain-containing protein n=1 Tax=Natranaerofaba carboxydovora TaxID=2742683 RepID=UPI001F12AFE2|nr:ATP-binding cassette domain-containing protein [Natranaerofaba carboxydovora]
MIKVENLTKKFPVSANIFKKSYFAAVDDVSFEIKKGETFGLVGESGCGKSTLAHLLLKLLEPSEGNIIIDGLDITKLKPKQLFELRSKIQIVFQHPESSFNPMFKIYKSMVEPLRLHRLVKDKTEEKHLIHRSLDMVGLKEGHLKRYPHELSGGQIQRLVLARILLLKPQIIVADEPTSMLDVSVQAQVLSLLKELQLNLDITLVLISHDLEVIRFTSDRLGVMHEGKLVEQGQSDEILNNPSHPYSKELISAFDNFRMKNFG